MAYVDLETLLSNAQALTATANSTNTYDTDSATNDIGVGEPLAVAFTVDVAADMTTGNETYQFDVVASAAANLGTPTTLASRIIPGATLALGYKFWLPVTSKILRYVGVVYTLGGTTPLLTITARLVPLSSVQEEKTYPKAYVIA